MDYHDELDNSTASAEPEPDSIEQLMFVQELKLLGQGYGDWTTEMEIGIGAQGEYTPATYSPTQPRPLLHHHTHPNLNVVLHAPQVLLRAVPCMAHAPTDPLHAPRNGFHATSHVKHTGPPKYILYHFNQVFTPSFFVYLMGANFIGSGQNHSQIFRNVCHA
jgi:hypothetical protein